MYRLDKGKPGHGSLPQVAVLASPTEGRWSAASWPGLVIAAAALTMTSIGCDDGADAEIPSCVEPDNRVYVRSRNPQSQVPLRWPVGGGTPCIGYRTDAPSGDPPKGGVDAETLRTTSATAFDAWSAPPCAEICFEHLGAATTIGQRRRGHDPDADDNANAVLVVDDGTEWAALFGNDALSATLVTSRTDDGVILDADILLNAASYAFVAPELAEDPSQMPCGTASADLLSVLTHEVGHFIGFGHSSAPDATMFGGWDMPDDGVCETTKRSLADGDLAGVCTVYNSDCE